MISLTRTSLLITKLSRGRHQPSTELPMTTNSDRGSIGGGLCDLGKLPETDLGQIRESVRPELANGSRVIPNVSTTLRTYVTK
jgi:hypothetical protein